MDRYRKQSIRSNRFIPKDNLDRLTIILAHNSIIESKACQSSFNRNVCLTRLKNSAKGDSTKIVPAHKQVQQHIVQLGET